MFLLVVGYIRGKSSPVPARRCFSGRLRGISAGISLLYPRGGVFPAGCGYIRAFFSPVPARRCFSGRLRVYPRVFLSYTRAALLLQPATGISARFSLLYPRGATFTTGYGYIRGKSSPVPARRYFSGFLRVYPREIFSCTRAPLAYAFRRHALAWLHAQRLLKSVSDGLSTGVCKQPRMAYVCGLNERYPGGTLSRA